MRDAVAVGVALGSLAQLTTGSRVPRTETAAADKLTLAEHRIDCFAVGLLVGLLSSLPTILQAPSQSLGPGFLAAFAAFTALGSEPTRAPSKSVRAALWVVRALVGTLAILAGWLIGWRGR